MLMIIIITQTYNSVVNQSLGLKARKCLILVVNNIAAWFFSLPALFGRIAHPEQGEPCQWLSDEISHLGYVWIFYGGEKERKGILKTIRPGFKSQVHWSTACNWQTMEVLVCVLPHKATWCVQQLTCHQCLECSLPLPSSWISFFLFWRTSHSSWLWHILKIFGSVFFHHHRNMKRIN